MKCSHAVTSCPQVKFTVFLVVIGPSPHVAISVKDPVPKPRKFQIQLFKGGKFGVKNQRSRDPAHEASRENGPLLDLRPINKLLGQV